MRQPTRKEITDLDGMTMTIKKLQAELEVKLWHLKDDCGAPTWASLNTCGEWVDDRGTPILEESGTADVKQLHKAK